ncbi:UDP-N-acetylmuramoyl-L-alanyl-D-glutamate--2,6-diaminopimelate ligase [Marinicella marina]|nr:UDP-N-acetylmuramoyl-L-alanyl-D-glutamate--2,6-diaminopimelate ligase [Marinicella marina]
MQNDLTPKNLQWLLKELHQLSADFPKEQAFDAAFNQDIENLSLDSRKIKQGDVFVALSGFNVHGMDYAYQAERAGAIAILTEPPKAGRAKYVGRQKPLQVPVIECADLSEILGDLSCAFYDHPSQSLKITAITGTNGKTSTAWLMMHALEQLGVKTGYIGTLGVGDTEQLKSSQNTTPSAIAIQKNLASMLQSGYKHVCIEVSSHALDQNRFNGTDVDTAIFTNLSRDHLDYHQTLAAYEAAKLKLFTTFSPRLSIINADDATAESWLQTKVITGQALTYGIDNPAADFIAKEVHLLPAGIAFELIAKEQRISYETALLGRFNVHNTLAVLAALSQDFKLEATRNVVKTLQPVPGRMNRIDDPRNGSIMVVDYAHTPDALKQVLMALRMHTDGQLWCVFGCGGNRDKGKRPMMGAIAEQLADKVILTDDNPRFESSAQIIADIESGMQNKPHVINDREQAIAYVLDQANKGDIILLAGKGHESTQEINGHLLPFNDMNKIKILMQEAT